MVSVLIVKPNGMKKQKVPRIETGIARIGIIVERKFWRNSKTTRPTRASAFSKVPTTSTIETFMMVIDSKGTL